MRVAYVLGAGASRADGVPLTGEIFQEALTGHVVERGKRDPQFDRYDSLFQYIDSRFGTGLTHAKKEASRGCTYVGDHGVTTEVFEKVFSELHQAATQEPRFDAVDADGASHLLRSLKHLMFSTLTDKSWESLANHAVRFLNRVFESPNSHLLVSFNYDLVLEKACRIIALPTDCASGAMRVAPMWSYGLPLNLDPSKNVGPNREFPRRIAPKEPSS